MKPTPPDRADDRMPAHGVSFDVVVYFLLIAALAVVLHLIGLLP
ncbi:hypothetical protein [Frankia sp. AgW1.1]|nr:hypothetical protein [Frankia sp. AgW1.1]